MAKSRYDLYQVIQTENPTFPAAIFISDSLKHLLARLLEKDPTKRISLVGAMHHPWVTSNGAAPLPNLQVELCQYLQNLQAPFILT